MQSIHLIYSVAIAFVITLIISPFIIKYLHVLKFGQNVRDDGPKTHLKKAKTPTMGGIIFLISTTITFLFFAKNNPQGITILLTTLSFGLIGFLDDYIKVVKKRSLGLRAYQKIILQFIVIALFIYFTGIRELYIPFGGTISIGWLYIPFVYFFMLGTVNSVNLTDGLDGLAAGVTTLVALFFMYAALQMNNNVCLLAAAVVGSLLGFLLFNSYPAKVFMGDAGSLALGGFISAIALELRMPLFLLIVGIIYIAEALSVMLQVFYFKLTKGKRIFKMAPIHHHFELSGWNETKVVAVFYTITAIACFIGLFAISGLINH